MQWSQDTFETSGRALTAQQEISRELRRDERLLWSGVPPQGMLFRPADAFVIPFSLLWAGFAIFWEANALSSTSLFMMLWGVPFVLMGLYIAVGRFFTDSLLRSRMYYGVTSRRVIIVGGVWRREVRSVALQGLTEVCLRERSSGAGTITFGPASNQGTLTFGVGSRSDKPVSPAFEVSADVRRVYDIVEDARSALVQ